MHPDEFESSNDSRRQKSPVTLSVLISTGGVLMGWGITWGTYSQRLESVETEGRRLEEREDKLETLALTHDRQLSEQRAQFAEILRRLERIEHKLER
jgi:hypothetical protein